MSFAACALALFSSAKASTCARFPLPFSDELEVVAVEREKGVDSLEEVFGKLEGALCSDTGVGQLPSALYVASWKESVCSRGCASF